MPRGIYTRTEKSKGKTPWNKGVKMWEGKEHPRGMLGKSGWSKGLVLGSNPEHSARMKGHPGWNKGKIFSKEARENMSKGQMGKRHSEETKIKISESTRGEKGNAWKGGATKICQLIRTSFKYRQWRSDVFTRDNHTCQECGARSGNGNAVALNADHIVPFSVIYYKNNISSLEEALLCEEFWNINNGRTLCEECHRKTDTYAGGATKYKNAILSPLQINA